jgi:hypothetical protein
MPKVPSESQAATKREIYRENKAVCFGRLHISGNPFSRRIRSGTTAAEGKDSVDEQRRHGLASGKI